MILAIIITTYNRPAELKACFDSIRMAIIPNALNVHFIIVDDASTDAETIRLMQEFAMPGCEVTHFRNEINSSIKRSLITGYDYAFNFLRADVVMNIDGDALISTYFIEELLKLKMIWQDNIVTGFNCTTRNRDGSERHKMVGGGATYNFKQSVGGINMVVHKEQYEKYMHPALWHTLTHGGNWDHLTCINSQKDGKNIICLQPSVIQHQATKSSMGHNEPPDVADDFKPLVLRDVTLVCVDDDYYRTEVATKNATKNIFFGGKSVIIYSGDSELGEAFNKDTRVICIPRLGSKEAYSRFIMDKLFEYVTTSHILIVQHDGYPVNWKAWRHEWLQYDYIGATWWYKDGFNVGNGGFSLRSQKLCRVVAGMNWPIKHPEDEVICRYIRPILEQQYAIKFAPESVAEQFSYEGWQQPDKAYTGQFGFHGSHAAKQVVAWQQKQAHAPAIMPPAPIPSKPSLLKPNEGLIFNQFLGLGDILFLIPLARHYMAQGHDIVWPVANEYAADLKRHFPDIQFVPKSAFPMQYDRRDIHIHRWQYGNYKVLPFRWNVCNTVDGSDCMTSKYTMMGEDWRMWRGLEWKNVNSPHKALMNVINNGKYIYEYELHCGMYGCLVTGGKKQREIKDSGLPVIKLDTIIGYSLLDWSIIFENATIIHAVSSSSLYVLEVLNLKAKEIHLYGRDNGMRDHELVAPIRTKNYILHP